VDRKPGFCAVILALIISGLSVSDSRSEGFVRGESGKFVGSGSFEIVNNRVVSETIREVTAYNAGDPKQTADDPCISASGENICKALEQGKKRCAANFVSLGTLLHIDKYGVCLVTDRMNHRYKNRVDIAMRSDEYRKARKFGRQKLKVKILKKATTVASADASLAR
jgi:3D (Asp-Asp-Asp) domain-containing protein